MVLPVQHPPYSASRMVRPTMNGRIVNPAITWLHPFLVACCHALISQFRRGSVYHDHFETLM